jgi:ubiquinol-cytochrome c reductase cytochrome b subunit
MDSKEKKESIIDWINYRLPIFSFLKHFAEYRAPKNLSYLWNLGAIAGVALVIQIVTGIFLAMHYNPSTSEAFNSVENIMRNVNYGWLLRYIHAVGASMFFVAVYIHMFRGIYYGSYKKPRELLWIIGLILFIMMMATAFMGYVLPWGQMSYWAATVITNLFSAIPVIGDKIVIFICGGYSVSDPTLNRFFTLHYLLPFILFAFVFIHVWALHTHGSNNPKGIDIKSEKDTIPFHPYYTIKDFFSFGIYFLIFAFFIFWEPNYLGHPDNYIPANPMVTPEHIVPEWYFLPFYAILRSIPSKLGGVISMFSALLILFFLPWIDRSPVRSAKYRPWYKIAFWFLLFDCIALGYLGGKPPSEPYLTISRLCTAYYFLHFLIVVPLIAKYEKPLPLPESISE